MVALNLVLESDDLAHAVGEQPDEPGALPVHEDDERGRRGLEQRGEVPEMRRVADGEEGIDGHAQGEDLTQSRRSTGEERDSAGVRELHLLDERLALFLHPRQIGLELGRGARPSLADLVSKKHAGALALLLVHPARVEVHTHHRRLRRREPRERREARSEIGV